LSTYVRTNQYEDGAKEAEANGAGTSERGRRGRRNHKEAVIKQKPVRSGTYREIVTNTYNHFGTNGMMDQWSGNITGRWCTCEAEEGIEAVNRENFQ